MAVRLSHAVLALIVFFVPVAFHAGGVDRVNMMATAAALFVASAATVIDNRSRYAVGLLAAWLIVSPFVLHYHSGACLAVSLIFGLFIFVYSLVPSVVFDSEGELPLSETTIEHIEHRLHRPIH